MINYLIVDEIIKNALKEDCPFGDITTASIVNKNSISEADLIQKEDGIICGIPIFKRVFQLLGDVEFEDFIEEGSYNKKNTLLLKLKGNTQNILIGERVALNLLQRLSGISTLTNIYVKKIQLYNAKILDTRKTTPNLRELEKYAVKIGGGNNHRYSLSDSILIKDNHIGYAGSITKAVDLARGNSSFVRKIEVEAETSNNVLEALEAKADIIMLDNMSPSTVAEMVKLIDKRALIECSGNMNLDTIEDYASTGVDYISIGSLTHSVKSLDISLKNLKAIK